MEWSPQEDPVERSYLVVVVVPPTVEVPPLLQVVEGGPAELVCTAGGSPAPLVRWTGPRGQEVAFNSSTLRLARVARTDAGLYTCRAENGAGYQAEGSTSLDIQCELHFDSPPSPISSGDFQGSLRT